MNINRYSLAFLSAVLLAGGCQTVHVSSARHDDADWEEESHAEIQGAGEQEREAASPDNEYEEHRVHEAMRGLEYESGRVEIDAAESSQLVGHPNAAAAVIERENGLKQLMDQNDPITAIATFTRAVINDPTDARSYEALGRALMFEGESPDAEAAFRTALDLDPNFVLAGFQLGSLLQMTGRNAEAVDQWLKVVQINPNYGEAHSRLAIELYYAGRYDEAWQHVHEAQRTGAIVPPQFLPLLSAQMAEPTAK